MAVRKLTRSWLRWQMKKAGIQHINTHISNVYADYRSGRLKGRMKKIKRHAT